MCKRLPNDTITLNRYINPNEHDPPQSSGTEEGGVLLLGEQTYLDGVVTCQFNLSGFNNQTFDQLKALRPLSQSESYYPLFAAGSLADSSK